MNYASALEIFGLQKECITREIVRKRFLILARLYHPDKKISSKYSKDDKCKTANQNKEFVELHDAYNLLINNLHLLNNEDSNLINIYLPTDFVLESEINPNISKWNVIELDEKNLCLLCRCGSDNFLNYDDIKNIIECDACSQKYRLNMYL